MKKIMLLGLILCIYLSSNTFAQKNKEETAIDKILKRTVMARVFNKNFWTLQELDAQKVGETLAKLKPSYVSNLIHLDNETPLSEKHIQAFQNIQNTIKAQNPDCKFDFVLNPRQYRRSEEVIAKMKEISSKIQVDIWFLDYYTAQFKGEGNVLDGIMAFARSQNQLVGANSDDKSVIKNVDFIVYHDGQGLEMKQKAEIEQLRKDFEKPILVQVNNDTDRTDSDNIHTFIKKWDKTKRELYIKRLARNQMTWKFRLAYPVFFPVYLGKDAYNATKDGNLLEVYLELMRVNN